LNSILAWPCRLNRQLIYCVLINEIICPLTVQGNINFSQVGNL